MDARLKLFQSAFKGLDSGKKQKDFAAPELGIPDFSGDSLDQVPALENLDSAWDIAVRYHELKAIPSMKDHAAQLRRFSAQAVLERAREILGSVVHPMEQKVSPLSELPVGEGEAEFDFDETLDASPLSLTGPLPPSRDELWMSYSVPRRHAVLLSVDTSLSMTGEKLALTAVALAVVLLQFPDDPVGIVAFENEAVLLKHPSERISVQQLVERFLDVPAQGYTHLEAGLKRTLELEAETRRLGAARPPSTILLTDGKYTAGRDPGYLAPKFSHLVVLKMGSERASLDLCRELARGGKGALREVVELESLPGAMYGAVKDVLRGRTIA